MTSDVLAEVNRALDRDDTGRAVELAEQALAAGTENPLLLNLAAFGMEQRGDMEGALTQLRRALTLAPTDPLIATALGRTLSQLGREAEALAAYDAVLAIAPRHAPGHHGRGLALTALGQEDEARREQMIAADLDPNYPDPLGALADHALKQDRKDLARTLAERAIALDRGQPAASMVLATLDAGDGKREEALRRCEALLSTGLTPLHRAAAEQLLGEQLDALGQRSEAMAAFMRSARLTRATNQPIYERRTIETGLPLTERLRSYFARQRPEDWAAAPGSGGGGERGHVFLVGFVRSGTTLLEQVLASHPDVVALEEQPTLRAMAAPLFQDETSLERLRSLGEAEAEALRADYWRRVRECGADPTGKVFVDKAPLSTIWLPAVAKLFPKARVLLAVRDPRDVVISAFRHRFVVNALSWPFTDLVETARFYSGVMELASTYRDLLPTPVHQHRHEDLIENFDQEVQAICDFLGIDWTSAMRDFAETARRRDVRTPSRDQVRQGLNNSGVGRWRTYGPAIDPILPILQPWVERYGYKA